MGGGVLLIPILTVVLSVAQKSAQAVNLLAFIPMSVLALVVHLKNKRVKWRSVGYIIVPAVFFSCGGSLLALSVSPGLLGTCYGVFLSLLGVSQAVVALKSKE